MAATAAPACCRGRVCDLRTSTPAVCAMASTIRTPGMTGKFGEVALEKRLVMRDVLDADDARLASSLHDAVDQKEGIAMGQDLLDRLNIQLDHVWKGHYIRLAGDRFCVDGRHSPLTGLGNSMDRVVSAVNKGRSIMLTSQGRPVVKITPGQRGRVGRGGAVSSRSHAPVATPRHRMARQRSPRCNRPSVSRKRCRRDKSVSAATNNPGVEARGSAAAGADLSGPALNDSSASGKR